MAQTFQKRHFYALADALRSVKTSRALVETIADVLGENPRNGLVNRYGNPHFDRGRFVAVALGKPWRMVRYSRCLYDREGKPRECDGCGSIQGRNPSGGPFGQGLRKLRKPRKTPNGPLVYVCRNCDPENTSRGSPYP